LHGQQHHVKTSNLANCPLGWQLLLYTVALQKPTCLVLQPSCTEVFPGMGMTQKVMVLLIIFKSWPHDGCKNLGSHSGAAEDSRLLQCDAVTLGEQFLTFQRHKVSACLGSKTARRWWRKHDNPLKFQNYTPGNTASYPSSLRLSHWLLQWQNTQKLQEAAESLTTGRYYSTWQNICTRTVTMTQRMYILVTDICDALILAL
jgi:hypothetical protein